MRLMVVGCGFVGSTVADNLESVGQDVIRIDPKLNNNTIKDFKDKIDGAIICLPTPTVFGIQDASLVEKAIEELGDVRILVKSTVLPNVLENYGKNVSCSPEFLREKYAKEDYINQNQIVWGGNKDECLWWIDQFKRDKHNIVITREAACLVKYVYNCWLATKVAFFHELSMKLDKSYDLNSITNTLAQFKNIGPSHMKVMKLGYDGSCFPKDMDAFAEFTDSEILKKIIEVNNNLVAAR